jgi:hypothetical protein
MCVKWSKHPKEKLKNRVGNKLLGVSPSCILKLIKDNLGDGKRWYIRKAI